jgi:hypothetical protein
MDTVDWAATYSADIEDSRTGTAVETGFIIGTYICTYIYAISPVSGPYLKIIMLS